MKNYVKEPKKLFKGVFNNSGELIELFTTTNRDPLPIFHRRLAKKLGLEIWKVKRRFYDGTNVTITEIRKEQDTIHPHVRDVIDKTIDTYVDKEQELYNTIVGNIIPQLHVKTGREAPSFYGNIYYYEVLSHTVTIHIKHDSIKDCFISSIPMKVEGECCLKDIEDYYPETKLYTTIFSFAATFKSLHKYNSVWCFEYEVIGD